MRLKDVALINQKSLSNNTQSNYVFKYIDISSVDSDGRIVLGEDVEFGEAPSRARRIISKGDVLVSTVRTYLRAIASVDFDATDIIASTGFAVCTPNYKVFSKYLMYALHSDTVMNEIIKASMGVSYPAISTEILSAINIPYVTNEQQSTVVCFLSKYIGKIDEQVKLLEKKVEAYKNLKRSFINETVTRGLDKNVKLKDSGVDWIGMVPEAWEVKRLESCIYEVVVKNNPVRTTNLLSLIKDVGVIPYSEKGLVGNKEKLDYSEYKVAYPNTIVTNSMNILIGSVGLCNYEGCVSPVYYVFKTNALGNIKYINYLFSTRAFQRELRKYANGILEIRLRVSASDILKCEVPLPCIEEQQAIANYLDDKCDKIDKAIELVEKQIDAYKRLKRSLINEVVTGKRRVA